MTRLSAGIHSVLELAMRVPKPSFDESSKRQRLEDDLVSGRLYRASCVGEKTVLSLLPTALVIMLSVVGSQ